MFVGFFLLLTHPCLSDDGWAAKQTLWKINALRKFQHVPQSGDDLLRLLGRAVALLPLTTTAQDRPQAFPHDCPWPSLDSHAVLALVIAAVMPTVIVCVKHLSALFAGLPPPLKDMADNKNLHIKGAGERQLKR